MALYERLKDWYKKLEAFANRYLLRQEIYAVLLFLGIGMVALLYRGGRSLWYSIFPEAADSAYIAIAKHTDSVFAELSHKSDSSYFYKPADSVLQYSAYQKLPAKSASVAPSSIILNRASSSDLARLPGIGEVMSKRIIAYREFRGKFRSLDELMNVDGIGPKKYKQMKPYLRLD